MKVILNENEIRSILAEALCKKLDYAPPFVDINPDCCWFDTSSINEPSDGQFRSVEFCYETT